MVLALLSTEGDRRKMNNCGYKDTDLEEHVCSGVVVEKGCIDIL